MEDNRSLIERIRDFEKNQSEKNIDEILVKLKKGQKESEKNLTELRKLAEKRREETFTKEWIAAVSDPQKQAQLILEYFSLVDHDHPLPIDKIFFKI
ncbi:MAG: hypothetical protein JW740_03420 [Candidatus Zambryskibacteria bacterium]|nr:hypothetical protein [Candidatus Zambryskibacteria bacterium]